jgi:hypothetical protein
MGVFLFVPQVSHAGVMNALTTLADLAAAPADFFYGLFARILFYGIATPLAWILNLSGQIMDMAITLSLSATTLFNSDAISIGWKAVRDIFNMFFIFSLIYISIKTILGSEGHKTSTALKNVIIAAVLINFSLYFTKIAIDISNVFAVWIYNGIQGLTPGNTEGISGTIRNVLGLEKMFQTKKIGDLSAFAAMIALIFLYLASIKVFLEVSFLFITRTVIFVFLLILSPIGFVGDILPKLSKESGDWRKELFGQAVVAPVFLLLLYITLLFVDSIQKTELFRLTAGQTEPVTHSSFTFADYAMFFLIYLMIKKSLDKAKEFSGKSGEMITGAIKGGLGIALGGIGVGVAGRLASVAAKSATISNLTNSSSALGRMSGRAALTATNAIANSSFGLSGALKESKLDKALPKSAFKDVDKGYVGKVKAEEKAQEQYAATLGKGIKGEIARQKYAQDMKKTNSLFDRTILGASIGTLVGRPAGIGAADDIQKKADAAFKVEAKKAAKKAKDEVNGDSGIVAMDKELKKLLEQIESNTRETSEFSEETKIELEGLKSAQTDLTKQLSTFNKKESKIGNKVVDTPTFERERKVIQDSLNNLNAQIKEKRAPAPEKAEQIKSMKKRKEDLEENIEKRKGILVQEKITELEKKGIKLSSKNMEGLEDLIKKGEEVEKEDVSKKVADLVERSKEPEEKTKPAEEPKTKPSSE